MTDLMTRLERLLLENPLGEAALQFALAQMVKLPAGAFKVQATYNLRTPMRDCCCRGPTWSRLRARSA